jgi:hypothetical protein
MKWSQRKIKRYNITRDNKQRKFSRDYLRARQKLSTIDLDRVELRYRDDTIGCEDEEYNLNDDYEPSNLNLAPQGDN